MLSVRPPGARTARYRGQTLFLSFTFRITEFELSEKTLNVAASWTALDARAFQVECVHFHSKVNLISKWSDARPQLTCPTKWLLHVGETTASHVVGSRRPLASSRSRITKVWLTSMDWLAT